MLLGYLKRLVDAFLDRNGRDDDYKLGESVALVQLEDGAQIHIRFPGSRLHFNREIARVQAIRRRQAVPKLNILQVFKNFLIKQSEPITDSEIVLGEGEALLWIRWVPRDSEVGSANLLATEEVANCLNRLELEIEIRLEVELHSCRSE